MDLSNSNGVLVTHLMQSVLVTSGKTSVAPSLNVGTFINPKKLWEQMKISVSQNAFGIYLVPSTPNSLILISFLRSNSKTVIA